MSGACSGTMSAQGLKQAGEPTSDNKPGERRRGAAGRAAVLRRAPSDSDCSGETASLSADSGERRPAPPPPRSGKTRGRRRGSEWEVLEGLKDGQRFERRPEVFNGYLHKKRKWPLKGWHKRFFVVDGGILVYARSPTDVARGRLHGSLDVGLSVISAKPRRRRIDIDADEFIYHLRAKTPDVFRTWLNVLKAHRLYRQHLLTFGARESVPKIHAPLDDLPPTDTSSHVSHSSAETFSTLTNTSRFSPVTKIKQSPTFYLPTSRTYSSIHGNKSQNVIIENSEQSCELEIKIDAIDVEERDKKLKAPKKIQNGSLCSMCCIEKRMQYKGSTTQPSQNSSLNNDEAQVQSTNLDLRALKSMEPNRSSAQNSFKRTVSNFMSTFLGECNLNPSSKVSESPLSISSSKTPQVSVQSVRKHMMFGDRSQTTLFFFSRKNRNRESVDEDEWVMKRSRKSTNVFKYRNSTPEPLLKRPISKCMLLAKYKLTEDESVRQDRTNKGVLCDLTYPTSNKSIQDVITPSEYDDITEKLILTIFGNHMEREIPSRYKNESPDSKFKGYVNQVVKELYSVRQCQSRSHPVTFLFRSLLDYYLNNTGSEKIKQAMQKTKSVPKQSNKHFTKDAMISSEFINSATKETQVFEKHIEVRKCENATLSTKSKSKPKKCLCEKETTPDPVSKSPKGDTDSFEKERRIQELERLMKNTVYLCETVQSMQSIENDIKITKTLINNLSRMSKKSGLKRVSDEQCQSSNESTELPAIQDTINRLISETEMPPEMAKEFLNMYLDVLCNESSKHDSSSSRSSDTSKSCRTVGNALPSDGVQTEFVVKKVSRSVTASPNNQVADVPKPSFVHEDNKRDSIDSGQLYLQKMLDEITTVFTENRVHDSRSQRDGMREGGKEAIARSVERSRKPNAVKNHVYEVKDDNSVVIDLSKYDLHRISMVNDVTSAKVITVKIKLKEKAAEYGEWKHKHLNLKFSNDHQKLTQVKASTPWPRQVTGSSKHPEMHFMNMQAPYITFDPKNQIELKPYISTSDATSKGNPEGLHGSDSFNLSVQSSGTYPLKSPSKKSVDSDHTQCFLLSSLRKRLKLRVKSKKQLNKKTRGDLPYPSCQKPRDGFTVFEKEPPSIIDERFILLLLENLTLLSKNLPEMYKEIGKIYLKLKNRHDKTNDIPNSANLGLLGNVSKEPSLEKKIMIDGVTQYDATDFPEISHEDVQEVVPISVNTNVLAPTDNVIDKSASAYELPLLKSNQNKRIENIPSDPDMAKEKSIETQTSYTTCLTTSVENVAVRKDQAVSIQKWSNKLTQECAISTVIKCSCDKEVLNFANTEPQEQIMKKDTEIVLPKKFKKKQSAKLRQDLIKQINLLSSSLKALTPSQTQKEKKQNRHANCLEKDFRVYQLFPKIRCKLARSGSVTDSSVLTDKGKSDDLKTIYRCSSVPSYSSGLISPTAPPIRGPQAGFVSGTPGGRLASWIIESGGPLESASRELGQAQLSVQQLQRLLEALELQTQLHHDTDVSLEGASPNVKKDRRKFGLRKKKSNNKCGSVDLAPAHLDPSSSQMALSALTAPPSPGGGASSMPNSAASLPIACAAARPQSLPGAEALATGGPTSLTSLTPDHQLREDFTVLAKDLVASLKTIVSTLVCERGRLRAAMEAAETTVTPGGAVVAALRTNLSSALQQNSELRSRLTRIHDASDLAELSSVGNNSDPVVRQFPQSLSYSSSCVSASEFFDAEEHDDELKPAEIIATDEAGVIELDGDSSSEAGSLSSEEGSASSDNSDGARSAVLPASRPLQNGSALTTPRRARLPCPRPTPASPSLWNLLYKNIGKDLSQISMPVTINEPLNMLQRLCEELEYSELLDAASECSSEVDRMSIIAAFAVSAYAASAHRAASKPFNPLLGETYECIRPDRDFRFIAEQVSHHPPISACHAESPRWTFWQEARIKTKFWGKSMEFQPAGRVHVRLAATGDHYSWNKVTTCVHNLFGGQRWVDQYGDMHIVCHGTDITCKLNFVKASSWSGSRHEVRGAVLVNGASRARLQGRWSEGLHAQERALWRPGAMPPDYELYYGFTRFAMELNELEPGMREILPNTDTRLRPDQRALEEGDVDAAEQFKLELEQAQRERRRDGVEHRASWFRKSVEEGEEMWVFTGEYWKAREAGFGEGPRLW